MPKKTASFIFGKNRGLGVYRDKNQRLNYKATGSRSMGLTDRGTDKPRKPVVKSAPEKPKTPPVKPKLPPTIKNPGLGGPSGPLDDLYRQQAADITGYNAAFADILKGMAPQISDIYSGAAGRISDYGHGTYEGLRGLLGGAADQAARDFHTYTGNLTNSEGLIPESYNADKAADIGYSIGAYLPAKTLEEQGAAFGAAAAFAPGMAHQQGLYALRAAQREAADRFTEAQSKAAAEGAPGASKASASLSKALGYLVDVYGKPILNKKGKPIMLPEPDLTPYQQASLGLRKQDQARYVNNENFDRWVAEQNIGFKNRAEQRSVQRDIQRGRQIDVVASRQSGVITYKNGEIARNARGKPISWDESRNTPSSSGKRGLTPYQQKINFQKAVKTAASKELKGELAQPKGLPGWYVYRDGVKGEKSWFGAEIGRDPNKAQKVGGYDWWHAIVYIQNTYGLTRAQARRVLILARWTPPAKPKPKPKDNLPGPLR